MAKSNITPINVVKRMAVGESVENLDVVITTAGGLKQVNPELPKKAKQDWEQPLGITDVTGHIWAIVPMNSYNPLVKGRNIIIKKATIDEFTNKGGTQDKRLLISEYEEVKGLSEPPEGEGYGEIKGKFEGILDPLVESILRKYDISTIEALWPCTRKTKGKAITHWIIYHRYCEQIAAKANITFDNPELIVNEVSTDGGRTVVLLVRGRLGYIQEWSYGEASPGTTFLPYVFAMAEKRAKDRVILKLAGFHGMVYSESEENWENGD